MRPFQGWRYFAEDATRRRISARPRRQRRGDARAAAPRIARSRAALTRTASCVSCQRALQRSAVTICSRSHSDGGSSMGRPDCGIPVDDVEQLRIDAHVAQVDAVQFAKIARSGCAPFVGYVGRQPIVDGHAGQDHLGAWRQAAMDATGQHQHAGEIAMRCPADFILASSGPPGRLSAKHSASGFPLQAATSVVPDRGVDAASCRIRPGWSHVGRPMMTGTCDRPVESRAAAISHRYRLAARRRRCPGCRRSSTAMLSISRLADLAPPDPHRSVLREAIGASVSAWRASK